MQGQKKEGSMKKISGTKEWAAHNVNCVSGCSHACKYCYSRWNAVDRFRQIKAENWETLVVREDDVKKTRGKKTGTIMFPTPHDITPEVLEPCLTVLVKMLSAGNQVLLVSKPHLSCIKAICASCILFKKQLLFRFTIGAMDDKILSYWEPGAPAFAERLEAVKHAFKAGFATSISMEPLLDANNVVAMFCMLKPCVTNSIWIGKLNKLDIRVKDVSQKEKDRITAGQTDDKVKAIYSALKKEPLVRWKESYKEVLGLKLAEAKGLDV
jgi:hypothetical protein